MAKSRWEAVRTAARVLGRDFEEAFLNGVCRLLAAIYHLGCAGATPLRTAATPTPASPRRFINRNAAERAARLLGCASVERLTSDVFGTATANVNPSSPRSPGNLDLLGGFVANLYAIATNTLRDLINKYVLLLPLLETHLLVDDLLFFFYLFFQLGCDNFLSLSPFLYSIHYFLYEATMGLEC